MKKEYLNKMKFQLFIFFFLLTSFPTSSLSSIFPGWYGESKTQKSPSQLKQRSSSTFDPTRVTQLSWHPRAFLYKGFLSDEECDHLIHLAKDKLEVSMVVDNDTGKSLKSEFRTSSGFFLSNKHQDDEIVANIEERIAAWTFLPKENGEYLHILRYEKGQKYDAHFDYFQDKVNQEYGGQRMATVLMYLSDVEKGGETVFPFSKLPQTKDDSWSECARKGYAVKPKKGDTLLFFSLNMDTSEDITSLHGSCPVIEGEKWSATKWIHIRDISKRVTQKTSSECVDMNESCAQWAAVGECGKNPVYMVGTKDSLGHCRKSCNVC